MKNNDKAEKAKRARINGRIRRSAMDRVTKGFRNLTIERLIMVAEYVNSLEEIDEEALRAAEAQAIQVCGYNPTQHMSEEDWAGQQRRGEQALKLEEEEALV